MVEGKYLGPERRTDWEQRAAAARFILEKRTQALKEASDAEIVPVEQPRHSEESLPAKEAESFDPHSVPSAQTLEEQKQTQEMREHLVRAGIIKEEDARVPDVDIDSATLPQYEPKARSNIAMQADMEKLQEVKSTETGKNVKSVETVPQTATNPVMAEAFKNARVLKEKNGKSEGTIGGEKANDGLYEKLTADADSAGPAVWRSNRPPRAQGAVPAEMVEPISLEAQKLEKAEQAAIDERIAAGGGEAVDLSGEQRDELISVVQPKEAAKPYTRTWSVVSRKNYDADGYAAAKPTEGVRSMGPKTRDEPRLGERVKMSQGNAAANTAPVIEAPGFVNVGTDPEKMKAAQVQQAARAQEPAPVRAPRERPPHPVDSEPLIQVETRKDQSAAVEPAASHRIEQTPVSKPDGRKEPVLGAEPIVEEKLDGGKQSPRAEGTWGEKMARLKTYVNALTEKMALSAKEGVKALTERGAKLAGYLAGRAKALDARIAQGSERQFGKLGDWYNKTPLWEKIVLGGSLAVGYGFTLPLSGWFAGAYAAPLIATRIAALAGSYRHNQKLLESINKKEAKGRLANTALYKWLASGTSEKERANAAMAKALLTSFGMAGGMSYAAHELAEHHVAEKIGQWLFDRGTTIHHSGLHAVQSPVTTAGAHQPHELFPQSAPAPAQVPVPTAEGVHTVPSSGAANVPSVAAETAASAPHVEVAAPAAPEIPSVYATASTGHGYEYMLKQMWHQLQDQHLDAAKYPEGSDIRTLLGATDKNIDGIVHQIASDPKHGFFNVDTHENVLIGKGDMLAFNTDGQVMHITPDGVANVHAPEGAAVTPPYHPEAPVAAQEIPAAQHLETVDLTAAQEEAAKHIEPMPVHDTPALDAAVNNPPAVEKQLTWHSGADGEGTLVDSAGHPVQSDVTEALPGANAFGIVVPENAPHLYADAAGQNLLAYGGSAAEQSKLIGEYLIRNPDKVVFGADEAGHRVAWHFLNGKVVAGPPMKNSGLLGLFSQWMKPPAPGDLAKVVR